MRKSAWIDLAGVTHKNQVVQTEVCIIGAGAAGIYLARQLSRQGKSVVLLEAGSVACADASTVNFDALFEASHYPGATAGRYFGMGGSTSRWGGQLVPHTDHDLRSGTDSFNTWSHIVKNVSSNAPHVLQQLGYLKDFDFYSYPHQVLGKAALDLHESGIESQAGLMMPFRLKNLVGLLTNYDGDVQPKVFFNAVVKSWALAVGEKKTTRIASVVAVSRNNTQIEVIASKFVLAAGAIESARILLEINDSAQQPVVRRTAAVGCYLADHLSVPIADVAQFSQSHAAGLFAPRFSGSWMRGFRFLERNPTQNAPRAFAHFIFAHQGKGFALAKEVLHALQGRRMPSISPVDAFAGMGDVACLAYRRFVSSRLYIPSGAHIHLQLDMEQAGVRENCVRLTDHRDAYGRRRASIHWKVSDRDIGEIAETAKRFLDRWSNAKGDLPTLHSKVIGNNGTKPNDAYHPVGTCRMGDDPEAVVDKDLKVWGMENLWVSSTGVLPSAGTANPTFTMLCLTNALAENLQASI